MRVFENRLLVRVHPGEFFASNKNVVLTTLLGSCVSACLYDPAQRIVGMNHFLLSTQSYNSKELLLKSDGGRYGINAMELLINRMMKLGAERRSLKAKVFGGAEVLRVVSSPVSKLDVGGRNARFVVDFLQEDHIPVVASDLEGEFGRVIYFDAQDFSVYVRKIQRTELSAVVKRDRNFIQQVQQRREEARPEPSDLDQIDLWD